MRLNRIAEAAPETAPNKTEVKRIRVAGEMQSGFDGAGAFYSRVEGCTLICWDDGSVTWEP